MKPFDLKSLKSPSFLLTAMTFCLSLVALIVYVPYGNFYSFNVVSVVMLIVVLLVCAAIVFLQFEAVTKYAVLLLPICSAVSLAFTLYDRVELIQGWATGMSMFGDSSRIGLLFAFIALTFLAALVSTVACFFDTKSA